METNGGGYAFIHPLDLTVMTADELHAMYTERSSVVLRVAKVDGTQDFGVLSQLPAYANHSLKLGLNENEGYITPVNKQVLGSNYLYVGFVPAAAFGIDQIQGLTVNGLQVAFTNCDWNLSSYLSLFPNINGSTPSSDYGGGGTYDELINRLSSSAVSLPLYYFMFVEAGWGGCGSYAQAGAGKSNSNVIGVTVGFR